MGYPKLSFIGRGGAKNLPVFPQFHKGGPSNSNESGEKRKKVVAVAEGDRGVLTLGGGPILRCEGILMCLGRRRVLGLSSGKRGR